MGTVRGMCSITKGVSITCCMRQSAQPLPDTESQLHFLCVSPFAAQGQTLNSLVWAEKGVRQLHLRGVQVPAHSQPGAHNMLHKKRLPTAPPPQNVVILLLLYHNRRKKDKHTFKGEIIPLSEAVLQPLQHTESYKRKFYSLISPDSVKNKYFTSFP